MITTEVDIRQYFYIPDNQILYVEKEYNEFLNLYFNIEDFESVFSHYYATLNSWLYGDKCNFIYIPKLIKKWRSESENNNLNDILTYYYPALDISSANIDNLLKIDTVSYTKFISKMFDNSFSEQIDSGLLMYSYHLKEFIYFPLKARDFNTLIKEIEVFFKEVKDRCSKVGHDNFSLSFPPDRDNVPDDEKADYDFTYRNRIADEIRERISVLKKEGHEEFLLKFIAKEVLNTAELQVKAKNISYLLDILRSGEEKPDITKYFKTHYLPEERLSPLIIDQDYRILLPEYNNLEIKLTPLQKAVYFLFLRHPKGILFKRLQHYQVELQTIYCDVSNREQIKGIEKSIEDICNPVENSINEKCSRIKEAFLNQFTGEIASTYYITGDRGCPKLITLDRALVTWKVRLSYDDRDYIVIDEIGFSFDDF